MWHKAEWIELQMRFKFAREGLLVKLVNNYTARSAHVYSYINKLQINFADISAPQR